MKYLELDNGGAVSVADIIAVTCSLDRSYGTSHSFETWAVYVHLSSGSVLTAASVQTPSGPYQGAMTPAETKAANARTHAQAVHWASSIRSMMLDKGPDSALSIFGELVNLCGQTVDTDADADPYWVTIFPYTDDDGGRVVDFYRVEWDDNEGEHHRQGGFRDLATAEAFCEGLRDELES